MGSCSEKTWWFEAHLSQEHVLHGIFVLHNFLAVILHGSVLVGVSLHLLLDLFVLGEHALRFGQVLWDVFAGDGGLCACQPLLEVVEILEELLQLTRGSQTLVAHFQLKPYSKT